MNWNWDSTAREMVAQSIYTDGDKVPFEHSFKVNPKVAKPFILTSNEELLPKALSKRSFATMSALMKYVENFEAEAAADIAANAASTTADNSIRDTVEEDKADTEAKIEEAVTVITDTSAGIFRKLWNWIITKAAGAN